MAKFFILISAFKTLFLYACWALKDMNNFIVYSNF